MNSLFLARDHVADLIEPMKDTGTSIELGRSSDKGETGDIWITCDGEEYHIQIKRLTWRNSDD